MTAAELLTDNPDRRYAFIVDEADTDPVIVTAAIRDVATFELAIPLDRYDGLAILELIERHAAESTGRDHTIMPQRPIRVDDLYA